MRKGRSIVGWLAAALLPVVAVAGAAGPDPTGLPDPYLPGSLDEAPVFAEGPDGTVWCAWAWHERGEFDLAVAARTPDGLWQEPRFLGRNDGLDQRDPALLVDDDGSVHVAFTVEPVAEVHVAFRPAWSDTWVELGRASPAGIASGHPTLLLVEGHVLLAYLTGSEIVLGESPAPPPSVFRTHGIQEGPDVIDPLGRSANRQEDSNDGEHEGWNQHGENPEETGTYEIRPGLGESHRRKKQ